MILSASLDWTPLDGLKYESARLAEQIQQLSCKLNVPQSHTDMAPELVHTDSDHSCTRPQANISRSEFVPQDLDSSATDDISESITLLPSLRVTNDYISIPLSQFLALEAETHGDPELKQTCHALHAELQNNLTYNEGPLSSDTVVRHDVSSPSQEEDALLDVSMPHHPPVSDGKMYADTGWCMSYQNCDPLDEESNHPEPRCQAPIIPPCDHVVPDVLLRTSQHRSAPNDHTGQPPGTSMWHSSCIST